MMNLPSARNIAIITLVGFTSVASAETKEGPRATNDLCGDKLVACFNYCDKSKKTDKEYKVCSNGCTHEYGRCTKGIKRVTPLLRNNNGGIVLEQ